MAPPARKTVSNIATPRSLLRFVQRPWSAVRETAYRRLDSILRLPLHAPFLRRHARPASADLVIVSIFVCPSSLGHGQQAVAAGKQADRNWRWPRDTDQPHSELSCTFLKAWHWIGGGIRLSRPLRFFHSISTFRVAGSI